MVFLNINFNNDFFLFSETLPEVYFTNCSKCSKDQTKVAKKTFKAFYSKRKADWEAVVMKYDPERKHEKKFLDWTNEP